MSTRRRPLLWVRTLGFLAVLIVGAAQGPAELRAAQKADSKFKLFYSDKAADPAPRDFLTLRPNVQQQFFVYVQNLTDKDEPVTVQLEANGNPVEGSPVAVMARGNRSFTQVAFGLPPAPPAPGTKPAPPALAEIKGAVRIVVLDSTKAVADFGDLTLAAPNAYVKVTPPKFDSVEREDPLDETRKIRNQLTVEVEALPNFSGPKCRVDLTLRPDRIPGLDEKGRKDGTRSGFLTKGGDKLLLTAQNLQFQPDAQGNGFVYLTIDGYERAAIYRLTVDRGNIPSQLTRVDQPVIRLSAPRIHNPTLPFVVALEVDNTPNKSVVEVALERFGAGKFVSNVEAQTVGRDREVVLMASVAGPGGSLLLKPEVRDWTVTMDVAEINGVRPMRVRLLGGEKNLTPLPFRTGTEEMETKEIIQNVAFDGTPPEGVKLVGFPVKLERGKLLPVKARAADPDTGIKSVVFFLGKPGPDGKPLPTVVVVPGQPSLEKDEKDVWVALLPAPTGQVGQFEVTVQATNAANLAAADTVTIQLVDADKDKDKDKAKGPASIEGKVTMGGIPQPKVPVLLRDGDGKVKDTAVTNDAGIYLFKEVPPGSYRITAVKTGAATRGENAAQVLEGQKKTDVNVNLTR